MNKISIIVRTKNEERWIGHCLKAIYEQDYPSFEVILVDNNSTDNTKKEMPPETAEALKLATS